jgi:two-component system sensor histidine kinase KdpD
MKLDAVLMEQVLLNLLVNAASYTPAATTIKIAARAERNELVITVADHGPGLPPESLAHVFEKFYRVPGAPTGGTGLGLSIVKGFTEAQGGQVEVVNRDGGGALFTLRFPIIEAPAYKEDAQP